MSPREWDNLGTIAAFHRNYSLGEIQKFGDLLEELNCETWTDEKYSDIRDNECLDSLLQEMDKQGFIKLPVYMYEHSGITISTTPFGCRWDSGQLGIIFVSREKLKQEFGWERITPKRREKIEQQLRGEIETYDQYLRGEVYGLQLEIGGEEVDSCWGFYDLRDVGCHLPDDAQGLFRKLMEQLGEELK